MIANDSFQTLAKPCQAELKVKGSRFLGYAAPVSDKEDAEKIIESIRKTFFDATHHCYAYRLGLHAEEMTRVSDDGEPSGSAGRPILTVVEGLGLTDLVVVVTRYFGGTKLGVGGLVRAYGGTASLVLEKAEIIRRFLTDSVRIDCTYPQLGAVLKAVDQFGANVEQSAYQEQVRLSVIIRRQKTDAFVHAVIEASAGKVQPTIEPR